jgi:hypothetical protein
VDPQPSRWPWNGKRDPYDDADYSQFNELPLFGSGVQIAVLQGTLNEAVPFVAQVKFAAGVKVPAHSQSATRHVTVLSGVLNIGLGAGSIPAIRTLWVQAVLRSLSRLSIISSGSVRRPLFSFKDLGHWLLLTLIRLTIRERNMDHQ